MQLLVVGLGGFLGAVLRYALSGWVQRGTSLPVGTLAVNVLGCLLLGAFMTLVEDRSLFAPTTRLLVTVGVLGALTTFSTFGWETYHLLRSGSHAMAVLSIAANVLLGLGGVLAGRAVVQGLL